MVNKPDGSNGKSAKRPRRSTKNSPQKKTQAILKEMSYDAGCILRHAVDIIKKCINSDTGKKTAKDLGGFSEFTLNYLSKAYKKGRILALIGMWKIEHPGAPKTQEQEAVRNIKNLFKS